jgi:xanthine/uracil/vitamin C permease (AzgA family)
MFNLRDKGTFVSTELLAGLTTWLTMAYIVVVNPGILAVAGIDHGKAINAIPLSLSICGCHEIEAFATTTQPSTTGSARRRD